MRVAGCCCRLAVVHSCWLAAYKIGDEGQRESRRAATDELRKSRGRGRLEEEEEQSKAPDGADNRGKH